MYVYTPFLFHCSAKAGHVQPDSECRIPGQPRPEGGSETQLLFFLPGPQVQYTPSILDLVILHVAMYTYMYKHKLLTQYTCTPRILA